mgnify:CR=1 FL=1
MPIALVTGAAGSVGREVVVGLVMRGWSVKAFDLPSCDFSSLENRSGVEVIRGDITERSSLASAGSVDTVVHLAALLPPVSEHDRERTFEVNVEGTRYLLEACAAAAWGGEMPHFVLASSVATYGDTSGEEPPVRSDHPQRPLDIYGDSKVAAEKLVLASGVSFTVLRIAPISVPAILEPPEVWPFGPEQRVEFIARSDAVLALLNSMGNDAAKNRVLNVTGGPTWQVLGGQYVANMYEILGLDPAEARYRDGPGWFDWYESAESEAILGYQRTSYQEFLRQLRQVAEEEFA